MPELWYYDASFGEGDTLTLHRCHYHGTVGAVDTAEPVPGERWHWQTGTRCGTVPVEWRGDGPQTPVPARHASIVLPATVRTAALHGGEVTLQVVNNHLGFEDFHSFTLTALAFTFRDRITHLDVASDGQTFALAVGGFVLLGRLPG